MAKPTYIVTDMYFVVKEKDEPGNEAEEFATEKTAIAAGKKWLATRGEEEVWVWKLSHVISKPEPDFEVEKVG